MNAKRLIYLSLFLGITTSSSSYADSNSVDDVNDNNVQQVCERYHITPHNKQECVNSYWQLQQNFQACSLSRTMCVEAYRKALQQWKRQRGGRPVSHAPGATPSNTSTQTRESTPRDRPSPGSAAITISPAVSTTSPNTSTQPRESTPAENVYDSCMRQGFSYRECTRQVREFMASQEAGKDSSATATISSGSTQGTTTDNASNRVEQPSEIHQNTTYESEYAKIPRPQEVGVRAPQALRKPQGIRPPQELRKPQGLRQPGESSLGFSTSYESEYSKLQGSR